jgi:Holliday junction resolvasome RuvABC DNA-binding subunit
VSQAARIVLENGGVVPADQAERQRAMSHYTRVRTKLNDATLLVTALKELGYTAVEVHGEPHQLDGYQGDLRPEQAEVIVRRKYISSASNDIGFARQADGSFEAIISGYDASRHNRKCWLS